MQKYALMNEVQSVVQCFVLNTINVCDAKNKLKLQDKKACRKWDLFPIIMCKSCQKRSRPPMFHGARYKI